jgi:uncharacterized phiE125 gp8 family phage protein
MGYQLVTPPTGEPVGLADAKAHLRVDAAVTDDDALITLLIGAVRQYAEQLTARSLITQQWRLVLDAFPGPSLMGVPAGVPFSLPGHAILLEKGPVQGIDAITYTSPDGSTQTLAPEQYFADLSGTLVRITPPFGQIWPITLPQIGSVHVLFTAGYGSAADVPAGLVQWIKLRLGTLYENREDVVTGKNVKVDPLPFVDRLLDPYRIVQV